MFGRKSRTIRDLSAGYMALEAELAVERQVTESLRKALIVAVDPHGASAARIHELMMDRADEVGIIQAIDGEFIMPTKYDWDALARDIIAADDETGGTSGSW